MKSKIEMPLYLQKKMQTYLQAHNVTNGIQPLHFINIMQTHHGVIEMENLDHDDQLDLRNPLIVILGDSVTGAHFEAPDLMHGIIAQEPADGYAEKFLQMIHDRFPVTTPSLINSGIAGDNIHGMNKRLERDVISHDPDLVILNASLNWSDRRGTLAYYEAEYDAVIQRILHETEADLVLMTANTKVLDGGDSSFLERTEYIRSEAEKYQLPLVDIYRLFEKTININELPSAMSNGENHPTPFAHTMMALALCQLFNPR
jgi:lysophospholipase L1-like esterase